MEITDKVRIEPFGVHVWSNQSCDSIFVDTEVKNYGEEAATFKLINRLSEKSGKQTLRLTDEVTLLPGVVKTVRQQAAIQHRRIWTMEKP